MGSTESAPIGFVAFFFENKKAEQFPGQKWSISKLWEHFWVPKHRMPIWLVFGSDNAKT